MKIYLLYLLFILTMNINYIYTERLCREELDKFLSQLCNAHNFKNKYYKIQKKRIIDYCCFNPCNIDTLLYCK
jgi:hypothetical protein